jgi:RNA polymerase sigma-70 factor (ECF subfamily)
VTGPTSGDRDAVGLWYSRHAERVFRVVLSRVRDLQLAEDLTADTFVRALRATQSATVPINDPGAWLATIARNLVRDHYRSSQHRREVTTGDLSDVEDRSARDLAPEQAAISRETHEELRAAVEQLPPAQRECLQLRFWRDLPVADTAAAMGCPVGTVKARQHHAVRRVAQLLPGDSELRHPQRATSDPLARARRAVAEVAQQVADTDPTRLDEPDRAQQLVRWHADDQAAAAQHRGDDRSRPALAAEGGAS